MDLQNEYLEEFSKRGIVKEGHFIGTSGLHLDRYVNKDALYLDSRFVSELTWQVALEFTKDNIDVVVAPEKGGIILGHFVARYLSLMNSRNVLGIYAEKEEKKIARKYPKEKSYFSVREDPANKTSRARQLFSLESGEEVFIRTNRFVIERNYASYIPQKRVLVIDDVGTSGGSLKKVVDAVRALQGEVVGAGLLWNRGGLTADNINVPKFFSLISLTLPLWHEDACKKDGPCSKGIPIDTTLGKGKQQAKGFLKH